MAATRRSFGSIEKRPRKLFRASYTGPDGLVHRHHNYFDARIDAEFWLSSVKRQIDAGSWEPPDVVKAREDAARRATIPLDLYAADWIANRPLKDRTRAHYRTLLDRFILPALGATPLADIGIGDIKRWHSTLLIDRPTQRAHTYGLLRTLLNDAHREQLIEANPCVIRGAGNSRRVREIRPLTAVELHSLADAMPANLRVAALLAGWTALRFGELAELRRSDIDLKAGTLRVSRAVVRVRGGVVIGDPKTAAGRRVVSVPPHLLPDLKAHLRDYAAFGRDGLVFPAQHGGHLAPSTLYGKPAREVKDKATGQKTLKPGSGFYGARATIGRPDLRWHDLRHTGAMLGSLAGASLRELQGRLGHSTTAAAMIYQHATAGRDAEIAAKLSDLYVVVGGEK